MKTYFAVFFLSSLSAYAQVKDVKIEINKGNRYTNDPNVPITVKASGAKEYALSNKESFIGARWISAKNQTNIWQIDESADGEKQVYIRFRDDAGNETEAHIAQVVLDRQAPTNPFIKISPSKKEGIPPNFVDIELNATDARYMKISSQKNFYNAFWQSFRAKIDKWDIGTGDGMKYIYVKYRDEAGNESEAVFDQYELDTHPPIRCKISIENNKDFCNNHQASMDLQLVAVEATQMMISENEKFEDETWIPYQETITWALKDRSVGTKKLYAKFRDNFGNESAAVSDEIMFDADAPADGKIEIEGEIGKKNPDNQVSLKLSAKGADFMIIANTVNFQGSRWQAYQETIPKWILGGGFGRKTVYVKFKDKYENETGVYEASIWIEQ